MRAPERERREGTEMARRFELKPSTGEWVCRPNRKREVHRPDPSAKAPR